MIAWWYQTHFVVEETKTKQNRKPRNVLLRTAPGLPSRGHAILVSFYVAINLALTFTNAHNPALGLTGTLGGRAAW